MFKMSLPFFDRVKDVFVTTWRRFPVALVVVYAATVTAIWALQVRHLEALIYTEFQVMLTLMLGFPWLVAAALFFESLDWPSWKRNAINIGILALQALHFFILRGMVRTSPLVEASYVCVGVFLFIAGFMAVFVAPHTKHSAPSLYWEYLTTMVRQIFLTALFMAILFIGLVLAIFSISYLFSLPELVNGEFLPQIWAFVVGIIGMTYFLSGVPRNKEEYYREEYKKAPLVLINYIIVPLLTLYTVILYVYAARILFLWDWPKGGVVYWILTFSVFGLIAYIVTYPLRREESGRWLNKFFTGWLAALLPLMVVYGIAIGLRLKDYGITENRYLIVILGVWLAATALYFLLSKAKHAEIVPLSLLAMALLSLVGPWSMFSLSRISQVGRLERLLIEQAVLINGKVEKPTQSVQYEAGRQISDLVHYLVATNRLNYIQPWFKDSLLEVVKQHTQVSRYGKYDYLHMDKWAIEKNITDRFGIQGNGGYTEPAIYFSYNTPFDERERAFLVRGYDVVLPVNLNINGVQYRKTVSTNGGTNIFTVELDADRPVVRLKSGDKLLEIDLSSTIAEIMKSYPSQTVSVPSDKLTVVTSNDALVVKFLIHGFSVRRERPEVIPTIEHIQGSLLITIN